jgi:RimJ/RimL family protein N-acetyltransferase
MAANWLLRGHGLWAVERRADTETIGFVLIGFKPGDHEPELGYMLVERARGNGYAFEAARAALRFAADSPGFDTLVSTIDPGNDTSLQLALKLGGQRDPIAEESHNNEILVLRYSL